MIRKETDYCLLDDVALSKVDSKYYIGVCISLFPDKEMLVVHFGEPGNNNTSYISLLEPVYYYGDKLSKEMKDIFIREVSSNWNAIKYRLKFQYNLKENESINKQNFELGDIPDYSLLETEV